MTITERIILKAMEIDGIVTKSEPQKVENEVGYIKLMKNETSKGVISYSWDVKVITGTDNKNEAVKQLVLDITEINDQMLRTFQGNGNFN